MPATLINKSKNFKRLIDFTLATIGFTVFSPVFLVITVILIFVNRGNAYFTQERPGRNGKSFYVIKFKTMSDRCDSKGVLLPDHKRLTVVGKFIRSTSLDELPQLINVLIGDMSLIGPRPLLVQYLLLYSYQQMRRHEVRPGITGWAQVNGRNTISWQQKFDYDVWYVEHISWLLDLKILLLTIKKVIIREGISSEASVTMEPFKGNN